jgi:hypothetical protein
MTKIRITEITPILGVRPDTFSSSPTIRKAIGPWLCSEGVSSQTGPRLLTEPSAPRAGFAERWLDQWGSLSWLAFLSGV